MSETTFKASVCSIADRQSVPIDTEKMRRLREAKGLTQSQAAERAGVAGKQYWNKIETGKAKDISISTLERIAAAIGVKAKDLLK